MDRIFGRARKPQAEVVLNKEQQECLSECLREHGNSVAACGMTAEEIREATGRMTAFARDFIRQGDNMEEYQRDYDTAGEEQVSR